MPSQKHAIININILNAAKEFRRLFTKALNILLTPKKIYLMISMIQLEDYSCNNCKKQFSLKKKRTKKENMGFFRRSIQLCNFSRREGGAFSSHNLKVSSFELGAEL